MINISATTKKGANVTSTALINCHSNKVKHRYILQTVLLLILLLLIITIISYNYANQETIDAITI